jgi:hypothetical protein
MAPLERCSGTYYPVECASLEKAETYQKAVQGCHMHHRIHIRNLLKIVKFAENSILQVQPIPPQSTRQRLQVLSPGPLCLAYLTNF